MIYTLTGLPTSMYSRTLEMEGRKKNNLKQIIKKTNMRLDALLVAPSLPGCYTRRVLCRKRAAVSSVWA